MASILPIATILQIADISQYLAANDISQGKKLKSGFLAPNLAIQIFNAKTVVRWVYNLNPSDTTLVQTGNYLFQLLGSYAIQAQNILNSVTSGLASITTPSNVSINVGQNAVFSVIVTSSSPYTVQWYRNGIIIAGATGLSYTLSNAQLTDSGATFYAVATNSAGPASSGIATLTVSAVLQGGFAYMSTDPGPTLRSGTDPFTYPNSFTITNGQPWVMSVPSAATPNMFIIVKGPIGQPIKTTWVNGLVNSGSIPDIDWNTTLIIGSQQYYYTRQTISLDPTQNLTLT